MTQKVASFPALGGLFEGRKEEKKKSDASFSLACLWLKDCSDSVRCNRGISVLFSSERGKTDISLFPLPPPQHIANFKEKIKSKRFPQTLTYHCYTWKPKQWNISNTIIILSKYKGHSTFLLGLLLPRTTAQDWDTLLAMHSHAEKYIIGNCKQQDIS